MTVMSGGRHLARTAVGGWVILVAVALAVMLVFGIELLRVRWKAAHPARPPADVPPGQDADDDVIRELDSDLYFADYYYDGDSGVRGWVNGSAYSVRKQHRR